MAFRSTKLALAFAIALTAPILIFAGGQPAKVRMDNHKNDGQDRVGISRAVQQGKGTGLCRKQEVVAAQGAQGSRLKARSGWGAYLNDSAFRK